MALLMVLLVWPGVCFDQLDAIESYNAYVEQNAQYVLLHVYHNRHFKNSRQFREFLEVLEDVEFRVKDFSKVALTDCEKDKGTQLPTQTTSSRNARSSGRTTRTGCWSG